MVVEVEGVVTEVVVVVGSTGTTSPVSSSVRDNKRLLRVEGPSLSSFLNDNGDVDELESSTELKVLERSVYAGKRLFLVA